MRGWSKQYNNIEELPSADVNLTEQGILLFGDKITFNGKLTYNRFYQIISDEGEAMNNPKSWIYNDKEIDVLDRIDFSDKSSPLFNSKLVILKFYNLRKIDEVAFVTSRFVHCPECGSTYVVPSSKIDFQQTYKCENLVGEKQCGTTLKKFPARKFLPTYIYEIAVEVHGIDGIEFKEFYLESFVELHPGFYSGMIFGRTEAKTNSFYFNCVQVKEEKSKLPFVLEKGEYSHELFRIMKSVFNHIKNTGFVIDEDKAQLSFLIETLKKCTVTINREINLDHSLYFGAPGIGKTYSLILLNHSFYSNFGTVSGPRFSIAGLTGGQRDVFYQDTVKKKNVPGLFSNQSFLFDEINNDQFLKEDKAVNLFKSVALASSGTSSTVGGKEFPRISLMCATANYDVDYLRYYENKVKKYYQTELKNGKIRERRTINQVSEFVDNLDTMTALDEYRVELPEDFDFYCRLEDYPSNMPRELKIAMLKVRNEPINYLTNFPKPLMERFYWSVLVHPKYDKQYIKSKKMNTLNHLKSRTNVYSQRELISQLYIVEFENVIKRLVEETRIKFDNSTVEQKWAEQVDEFLLMLANKYVEFFSMFQRISQVNVFLLYTLSLINKETELSFSTRRVFERLISLLHVPIDIKDFHTPDFENFNYIGENKFELLNILKKNPLVDIRRFVDYDNRQIVRKILVDLQNNRLVTKIDDYHYQVVETVEEKNSNLSPQLKDQNSSIATHI